MRAALQWISGQGQEGDTSWDPLGPAGARSCSSQCPSLAVTDGQTAPALTQRTHLRKQSTEIEADCSRWDGVADDSWDVRSCGCECPGRVQRHGITPRRAQLESARRSDRSFVKALFICENSLDVSHYQHVCDGCLSSRRNSNLRVLIFFCFRTERKKESNWENITIMILSSLHPSVSYSTSLAPHSLSVPYISCFYSSTAFTLTSHFISRWVLNSQWGWDEFSRFHFTSTLFQEFAWEKWYLVMCRELILLSSQEQVKLHRKQAGQALLVSPVRIRSKIWGN